MQENKSKINHPKEPDKPQKEINQAQHRRQKKFIVYTLMVILFAGVMWLIFAPTENDEAAQQSGFNTDVPDPAANQLTDDKQAAYKQEQLNQKKRARKKQMQGLAAMFGLDSEQEEEEDEKLYLDESANEPSDSLPVTSEQKETIQASANAYRDINRTLGHFYQEPKRDPEKEELKQQLEELSVRLQEAESAPQKVVNDPMALMEKSYQLANRYMPPGQEAGVRQQATAQEPTSSSNASPNEAFKNGKAQMHAVGEVREELVSGLAQPVSDSDLLAEYAQERNSSFHTAVGESGRMQKNTIRACIHDNQTITDGQAVRMRLLEPMRVGETVIPQNALITGMAKISGERLAIAVTSLEYRGLIIPVELMVIDTDGQPGIFIPGSMEMDAIKEIGANLGGNLGTTINLNQQSAANQLLTDLGKGAIQGTSKYISKKMRIVKVHLKAGHNLMLYQKRQ